MNSDIIHDKTLKISVFVEFHNFNHNVTLYGLYNSIMWLSFTILIIMYPWYIEYSVLLYSHRWDRLVN